MKSIKDPFLKNEIQALSCQRISNSSNILKTNKTFLKAGDNIGRPGGRFLGFEPPLFKHKITQSLKKYTY